jgi:hypothetical protein
MADVMMKKVVANEDDVNRDPLSGETGAHPLGTGAGAASGGMAGAAVGTVVGGPIGAVIGAVVGAVAGGLAGSGAAEAVNPTAEELFWRESYLREPFYVAGRNYEYYAPGFRAGWEGRVRNDGRAFDAAEGDLKISYDLGRSELDPTWLEIRPAAQAAWNRVDRSWVVR